MADKPQDNLPAPADAPKPADKPEEKKQDKDEEKGSDPPAEFLCPITLEVMTDPCMLIECGHTFERKAILEALSASRYKKCPQCRKTIAQENPVVPNHALRNMIQDSKWNPKLANAIKNDEAEKKKPETSKPEVELLKCPVTGEIVLAIKGPDVQTKQELNLLLVIDTSGSMNSAADLKGENVESTGMNSLDVVRAVGITLASALPKNATCGILSYNSRSSTILPPTRMDAAGKKLATEKFLKLEPGGATNLWDSIKQAFNLAREDSVIVNLTDGEPSRHLSPHGGFKKAVADLCEEYAKTGEEPPMQFMFGYGQSLQTNTMCDVSRITGGSYVYVADPNFICTAAAHTLGNVAERVDHAAKLTIDGVDKGKFHLKKAAKTHFVLGKASPKKVSLNYKIRGAADLGKQSFDFNLADAKPRDSQWATFHVARAGIVDILDHIPPAFNDTDVKKWINEVKAWDTAVGKLVEKTTEAEPKAALEALLYDSTRAAKDAEGNQGGGQVLMAAEERYFRKWGLDYLESLRDAHKKEAANNFKDKAMKLYGGATFKQMRDTVSSTFNKLPAPRCSLTERRERQSQFSNARGGGGNVARARRANPAPVRSMAYFNNASRPCIAGTTAVEVRRNNVLENVSATELKPGDCVRTSAGFAKIQKVFIFDAAGEHELVRLPGGLAITPFHPVFDRRQGQPGGWSYPIDIAGSQLEQCVGGQLVDLMLEEGVGFAVGNFDVASWGHGFVDREEEPVLGHAFFGSRAAISRTFRQCRGWHTGVVRVAESDLRAIRAESTTESPVGLVQSYRISTQAVATRA